MRHGDPNGPMFLDARDGCIIVKERHIIQIAPAPPHSVAVYSDEESTGGEYAEPVAAWGLWDEWDVEVIPNNVGQQNPGPTGRMSQRRRVAGALIAHRLMGLEPADGASNFDHIRLATVAREEVRRGD